MSGGRFLASRLRLALAATAVAAILAGCQQAQPADDNYGYGWSYDAMSASGVRLRFEPEVAAEDRADLAVFDGAFTDVETCLGIAAAGPLVVVVPRGSLDGGAATPPPGAHVGGLYYFDTNLVVVTDSLYALRHEFVHYLLDQRGYPIGRNRDHDHAAFATCTGPTYY